jgi:hypothetical protein
MSSSSAVRGSIAVTTRSAASRSPLFQLDRADATAGGVDARDERVAAHTAAELRQPSQERVDEPLRSAGGMPLPVAVVGGLPEAEQRAAALLGARARVRRERADRRAREIRSEPPFQQSTVGACELARQPQRAAAAQEARGLRQAPQDPSGQLARAAAGLQPERQQVDERQRVSHERGIRARLGRVDPRERRDRPLDAAVKAHASPVGEDRRRERVHLAVPKAGRAQSQLARDRGHVDDVVRDRMGVEAIAGDRLLGPRAAARLAGLLEHEHVDAGPREVARAHEAVVAGADDERRHVGRAGGVASQRARDVSRPERRSGRARMATPYGTSRYSTAPRTRTASSSTARTA